MPVRSSKYLDDRPARLHRKPLERLDACIPACYIADRAQAGGELAGCEFGDAVAPAPDVRRHEMRILGQPLDRPGLTELARADAGAAELDAHRRAGRVGIDGLDVADPVFMNVAAEQHGVGDRVPAQRVAEAPARGGVAVPAIVEQDLPPGRA